MRALLLAAAVAATTLSGPVPAGAAPPPPTAVLAVTDTGVNPYHVAFRDPSPLGQRHPSTYLPGFPKDAEALRLTFGAPTYREAVRADCERVWRRVRPGRLYWFPGTRIAGAISFRPAEALDCAVFPERLPIADDDGHGTMVASRAVAAGFGACPACRLVAIEGYEEGLAWSARNAGWIDAHNASWGPSIPAPTPVDGPGTTPAYARLVEDAARRHLTFLASGNGALTHLGLVGHPTVLDPRLTPSAVSVGGHDSGRVITWSDAPPTVVADACAAPAAWPDSLDGWREDLAGGTSGASPYAAGIALRALVEARRLTGDRRTGVRAGGVVASGRRVPGEPLDDGVLTLDEWTRVVLATASPRPAGDPGDGPACPGLGDYGPTLPVRWADLPPGYPEYLHVGYGALDRAAYARAAAVLAGRAALPDRAATDAWYAADRAARSAVHAAVTAPP